MRERSVGCRAFLQRGGVSYGGSVMVGDTVERFCVSVKN